MKTYLLSTVLIAALFLLPERVFAGNSPHSLDPAGGITTSDTSPKLSWQYTESCPASGNCFLVEIDDSDGFDSLAKPPYYTNNTYYSPRLSEGIWFWRVKGKDSSGNWSEWASSNFVISSSTTASPASSAVPSSSPSPTGSTTPASGSTLANSFTVGGVPASVNSGQSFSVSVQLSIPSSPGTNFYLKGVFIKDGGSNYFGLTQVSGNWIKNSDTFSKQYAITTDPSGNWSGSLQVIADNEDSGYTGSGNYIFKVGRYNESGSGPSWSNEVDISMSGQVLTASSAPKASTKSTPKPSASSSPKTPSINPPQAFSNSTVSRVTSGKNSLAELPSIASVAGESTVAAFKEAEIQQGRIINWWFVGAGFLIFTVTCGLIVKTVKKRYYTSHDFKE